MSDNEKMFLDDEALIQLLKDFENGKINWEEYYKNPDKYSFSSHTQMLKYLIVLFKFKDERFNYADCNIYNSDTLYYYEFCRKIDFTIALAYIFENQKLSLEAIKIFYVRYLLLNHLLGNFFEIMRVCDNCSNFFPNDINFEFYKLLCIFEKNKILTNNKAFNNFIFVQEYEKFNSRMDKDKLILEKNYFSYIFNFMTYIYQKLEKQEILLENLDDQELKFYTKKHLMLNFYSNFEPEIIIDQEFSFLETNQNDEICIYLNSLISDYMYQRNRFWLENKKEDKEKRAYLSILDETFALYDKIAYLLFKKFKVRNIKEHKIYFNKSFFETAELIDGTKLKDIESRDLKLLYLFSIIFLSTTDQALKICPYSIGNVDYKSMRQKSLHKSTNLINGDFVGCTEYALRQTRSAILTLISFLIDQ